MTAPQTSKKPNWFMQTLGSTLGRKLLMALTGLFLILFLTIHLIGNLQLLIPVFSATDNGKTFNEYAEFMSHNKLIQAVSIGNFFFIVLHIIVSIALTFQNGSARPVQYAYSSKTKTAVAARRNNMMVLGSLLLIFIVVHLVNFWGKAKFGEMPKTAEGLHDLYSVTKAAFTIEWLVGLYVFCMIALAFHLSHGFQSAFQTIGLNHKKYTPFIKTLGMVYSILIPLLYAIIPIVLYVQQMK